MFKTILLPIVGSGSEAHDFSVLVRSFLNKLYRVIHGNIVGLVDDYQALFLRWNQVETNHKPHTSVKVFVREVSELDNICHKIKITSPESITRKDDKHLFLLCFQMVKSKCNYHSTLASSRSHLTQKSTFVRQKVCEKHGSCELNVVYGIVDTRKGLLHLTCVSVDDVLMMYAETVEFCKNSLCGVKAFLVLKLNLICFFFANTEPFIELDTLIVIDMSSVGNVRFHDDTYDGHEVFQRQGLA